MAQKISTHGRCLWNVLIDQEIINRTKFKQSKKKNIGEREKERQGPRWEFGVGGWSGHERGAGREGGKDAIQI